ncbi:MAG: hypothetical protein ACE5JL_02150 [Dehalococcoidia bacterium]
MTGSEKASSSVKLTPTQEKEGYWVQESFGNLQVWHHKNQIALLAITPDIDKKLQDVVERRRRELKEVEEKTGWKPEQ